MSARRGRTGASHGPGTAPWLLLALVERQCDDFEGLRLAPEVDVQGGAGFGELDVDVGQATG